jgi:serine/threonine protein kinase/WD40 repeat protein
LGQSKRGNIVVSNIQEIRRVFDLALDASPQEREGIVRSHCKDDEQVARSVLDLLALHDTQFTSELDTPVAVLDRSTVTNSLRWTQPRLDAPIDTASIPCHLERRIGEGAHGVVYLGRQSEPDRHVAVKVLRGGSSAGVLKRFRHEYQTMAQLRHPGIATVFSAGESESGSAYFVMEYVEGEQLIKYANTHKFDLDQRLELFLQVCDVVQFAHQKGVIHRDLKPSNILVTQDQGIAFPKVIDFGVAKLLDLPFQVDSSMTGQGFLGTLHYGAPEQFLGSQASVDVRLDVHALGVILHELITGEIPWRGATAEHQQMVLDALKDVANRRPEKPSTFLRRQLASGEASAALTGSARDQVVGRCERELDWIVLKALSPEAERRYASVAEFARDVRSHLEGEVVAAKPPSRSYYLAKFLRRHRRVAFSLGMLAIVLLAATGVSVSFGAMASQRASESDASQYQASLNAAWASILVGDAASANQALYSSRPERRGWEWDLLRRRADAGVVITTEPDIYPNALAVDPGGELAAIGGQDGTVGVYDLRDGQRLLRLDGAIARHVAFAWDSASLFIARSRQMDCIALEDGEELWHVPLAKAPQKIAAAPAGVAVGFPDGSVVLLDAATGAARWEATSTQSTIKSVAYDDSSQRVLLIDESGLLVHLDLSTGQQVEELPLPVSPVGVAAIAPEYQRAAVLTESGIVSTHSLQDGRTIDSWVTPTGGTGCLAITLRGEVVLGGGHKALRLFLPGRNFPLRLIGHTKPVLGVVIDEADNEVISLSSDRSLRRWPLTDPDRRYAGLLSGAGRYTRVAAHPSDPATAVAVHDQHPMLLDLDASSSAAEYSIAANCAVFSSGGDAIYIGGGDGAIHVCDLQGQCEENALPVYSQSIFSDLITLGEGLVAACALGPQATVQVWDVEKRIQPVALEDAQLPAVRLSASPDGLRLAAAGLAAGVRVWNTATGLPIEMEAVPGNAMAVRFDGHERVFAGFDSGTLVEWELQSGQVVSAISAHDEAVFDIQVLGLHNRVVTTSRDGTLRVWDRSDLSLLLSIAPGEMDAPMLTINSLTTTADGEAVVGTCADGALREWRR